MIIIDNKKIMILGGLIVAYMILRRDKEEDTHIFYKNASN